MAARLAFWEFEFGLHQSFEVAGQSGQVLVLF